MLGGIYISSGQLYFPKVYNIEMDPHEDLNLGGIQFWPMQEGFKTVAAYLASLKKYPDPPAINFTNFGGGG